MVKTTSFRMKLWLYFILFAAIVFSLLWIFQTVFLQSFYNKMLAENTKAAAAKINADSKNAKIAEVIDRLAYDNSLLVFITDTDGIILYSSDIYKSFYYQNSSPDSSNNNPYRTNDQMNWQIGNYRNLPDDYEQFLDKLKNSESKAIEYQTDNRYICGTYMELENGKEVILYVSAALEAVGAAAVIIRVQLIWVTLLSLLIAFILAYFIAKRFSVPICQLTAQARKLGDDDYISHFQYGFCNELDELSCSLDQTAVKLSQAKNYQKELLANVSHDLRTPLTMIKGYAEIVRDVSCEDEVQRNSDINIIIGEADRLTALVNEILEYSQLQTEDYAKDFKTVHLSRLVQQVIDRFEPLFQSEGGIIERKIEPDCCVFGNERLLERAVYNLIDNAIRHTGKSQRITVAVFRDKRIRLEVQDYGDGIDESELAHIWEKYYTSRQRGHKGVSGLGLAIVRQIAIIHNAEYGADSRKGNGSIFWIELHNPK